MPQFNGKLLLFSLLALPLLAIAGAHQPTQVSSPPARNLHNTSPVSASESPSRAAPACPAKELLFDYEENRFGRAWKVPIWQFHGANAFFFTSGMTIDADGAPNAYNAENTGLDDLANAGAPGHWEGILQDKDGNPLVQGPADPYPGYYISCTSLADWTKAPNDPARYVDASKIPYIVLPGDMARAAGARPGDFAVALNLWNGDYSYAIFADVGTLGEGSIALANNLEISSDARRGGTWWGVLYLVFPGSGDHRQKSIDEIDRAGQKLLGDWGGVAALRSCADDVPRPPRPPFARGFRSGAP